MIARMVVLCMAGLLAVGVPVAAREAPFLTGTYVGKTTQKARIGFELASGATDCSATHSSFCLYQLDSQSANITVPCPGGGTDGVSEVILDPVAVPKDGVLRARSGTLAAGLMTYDITVRSRSVSGWIEEKLQTSGTPICSSGEVKFSTTRSSGVKR